jgi:uncharacterized membrane protein YbhN (UPF0104 family)
VRGPPSGTVPVVAHPATVDVPAGHRTGAGSTRAWIIARVLLIGALGFGGLAARVAFTPVANPGVQDCGPPVVFLFNGSDNRVIHLGDTGAPDEAVRAAQPSCRARALDAAGQAGRLFVGFALLAGLGAALGLVDDRVAFRRRPRFETLLREMPVPARARRGLVPRVIPAELGERLPAVEVPEVVGIVAWGVGAAVLLPFAGPIEATAAAFGDLRLLLLLVAAAAVAASVVVAAELRRRVLPGDGSVADAVQVAAAGSWLAAVRPVMGVAGLDVHRLHRAGADRARSEAALGVLVTVAAVVHGVLLAPVALAVASERHPAVVVKEPQLVLIGTVILLLATGVRRVRARWRGMPVRPSSAAFAELDRLAPDLPERAAVVGLVLATPLLHVLALAALLGAFGAGAPLVVVVFVALLAPVLAAVSPTPAGAGTVEAVTALALIGLGGLDPGRAVAVALTARVLWFWLPMAPGFLVARRLRQLDVL